jgi:hypothetical protein
LAEPIDWGIRTRLEMNRKVIILSWIAGVALSLLTLWLLSWEESEGKATMADPKRIRAPLVATPTPNTTISKAISEVQRINAQPYHELLGKAVKLPTDALTAFIDADAASPSRWIAAIDLCWDRELAFRALSLFPADPRILFRCILIENDPEARRQLMDRLKHADGSGSLGYYLSASDKVRQGKGAEAVSEFMAAMKLGAPSLSPKSEIVQRRAALEFLGVSPPKAAVLSMNSTFDVLAAPAVFKEAGSVANVESLDHESAAALGIAIGHHMESANSKNLTSELLTLDYQARFLAQLDQDTEYGDTGLTVGEKIRQVDDRKNAISGVIFKENELWKQASDADAAIWANTVLADGEMAAYNAWLDSANRN